MKEVGEFVYEEDLYWLDEYAKDSTKPHTFDHLAHVTVYKSFKAIARKIGLPDARFHDLRHTFAVISFESGDDVKTVQENMGHSKANTTLDVYTHFSRTMRLRSANNQQKYIESVI